MARVLTNNKNYYDIADAIRQMKNVSTTYKPREMASALKDIYSNEVEGVPPLTFESNGMDLLDYRIDGASGGVGDKTNNLFDGIFLHRSVIGNEVGPDGVNRRSIAIDISNYNNGEKITFSRETAAGSVFQMYQISSTQTGGKLNNESVVSGNSNTLLATLTITKVNEYPYLMIFLNGENKPIEDEKLIASKIMINVGSTALPYEPYGYKVPVVISGKNLLRNTAATQTINGVTFTVNEDKSIVANGTATSSVNLYINSNLDLDAGEYYLSCKCEGEFTARPLIIARDFGNYTYTLVNNQVNLFVTEKNGKVILQVTNGTTINAILYPMIRKVDIADNTYEPYHEPTTTNIYLDEPIGANESISLSDTGIDIPTIDGTNTLTIDTTVQPSNVYIQAPKDSLEVTQIANELEEI